MSSNEIYLYFNRRIETLFIKQNKVAYHFFSFLNTFLKSLKTFSNTLYLYSNNIRIMFMSVKYGHLYCITIICNRKKIAEKKFNS